MRSQVRVLLIAGCLIGAGIAFPQAEAQQMANTISVRGIGKAGAAPDVVELSGQVTAAAELAGDAFTKFRLLKEEALEKLGALNVEGLTVEQTGLAIGSTTPGDAGWLGAFQETAQEPSQIALRERLVIRLHRINELEPYDVANTLVKLIDAAKEAGVVFDVVDESYAYVGGNYWPTCATFKLSDVAALRKQALQDAVRSAKEKASEIAALTGGRLGAAQAVSEFDPLEFGSMAGDPTEAGSSLSYGEVRMTVSLEVQFAFTAD